MILHGIFGCKMAMFQFPVICFIILMVILSMCCWFKEQDNHGKLGFSLNEDEAVVNCASIGLYINIQDLIPIPLVNQSALGHTAGCLHLNGFFLRPSPSAHYADGVLQVSWRKLLLWSLSYPRTPVCVVKAILGVISEEDWSPVFCVPANMAYDLLIPCLVMVLKQP